MTTGILQAASESAEPLAGELRHAPAVVLEPGLTLAAIERRAIEASFRRLGGNISAMSRELGIGRTALYRKLRRYAAEPLTPTTVARPPEP